jgi:hypothetical protein
MISMESDSRRESVHEIEEEDRPFVNNGLPRIRTFAELGRRAAESFLVFQVMKTP